MIRIIDGLYLGNRDDAEQCRPLLDSGITHVLNCTQELPCYHPGAFTYLQLHLLDPDPRFADCLDRVCSFIDEGRRNGGVLVHCFACVSRSPSVVLAYLMHQGDTLEQAADRLGRTLWTFPDTLFLQQLARRHGLRWEEELRERLEQALLGRNAR